MILNELDGIVTQKWLQDELEKKTIWNTTRFPFYPSLTTKKKGMLGEKLVARAMRSAHHKVASPENPGHDRIIDGHKTEIKLSIRLIDEFIFNHISIAKDWERIILCGINANTQEEHSYYMTKSDLLQNIHLLAYQQGGKKIKNDDYILVMRPTGKWFNLPCFTPLSNWN